ncbi:MAG: electron transport complex subunit RsxC [Halanaerobiales bacterium]
MRALTFKQGIYLEENKSLTSDKPLKKANRPAQVIIPMQQHIGVPCKPLVKRGDHVEMGEKIGDIDGFISAPIHSSVSGTVKEIRTVLTPEGKLCEAVVIEADPEDRLAEGISVKGDLEDLNPDEIIDIIREAGIVGMGGATFPTHAKLRIPEGKKAEYLIINGAECEPFLTGDYRLMLERPEDIVYGMKALMKAIGAEKGIIGIEDNKADAIETLQRAIDGENNIEIKKLITKYPQGGERMLIKAILNREVPAKGLPIDVGVIVNNIATAVAVADAIKKGMPLIERSVTISGPGVNEPVNLIFRIGTPIEELLAEAGGLTADAAKVIIGGPMTGCAQPHLEISATKGTTGIIVLTENEVEAFDPQPCIRCARCVDACPELLMPLNLARYAEHGMLEQLEKYQVLSCIECGICSYVCPARRPLLHNIRIGKAEVMAKNASSKQG